jgi:hypothetical protein
MITRRTPRAQQIAEAGAVESGVLLERRVGALAHEHVRNGVDVRVECGARCRDDTVRRPPAPVRSETAVTRRMKVTRRHNHTDMSMITQDRSRAY